MTITVLGSGLLEVDLPARSSDPNAYRWDEIVTLFHDGGDGTNWDIQFPTELNGQTGTLIAVVTAAPVALNRVTDKIRRGAKTPREGTKVTLGTGQIHIRTRTLSGTPSFNYPDNAIGIKPRLDEAAVRSLYCQPIRLELHQ